MEGRRAAENRNIHEEATRWDYLHDNSTCEIFMLPTRGNWKISWNLQHSKSCAAQCGGNLRNKNIRGVRSSITMATVIET